MIPDIPVKDCGFLRETRQKNKNFVYCNLLIFNLLKNILKICLKKFGCIKN